jgi:hypothetical protein
VIAPEIVTDPQVHWRGTVLRRDSPASLCTRYEEYCVEKGLAPLDLGGRSESTR